jgi:hypothetical protein
MGPVRIAITAILLAVLGAGTALSVTVLPYYDYPESGPWLALTTAALWLVFALAVLCLRRVPVKAAVILVSAGALLIGGAAMAGPPNTSTDSARYAWDGIVQNAGISPYRYVPTDPALAELRTDWLFPEAVDGECPGERIQKSHEPGTDVVVCTALNRGTVNTIYPPASELLFAGVRAIVGPQAEYWPMQLVGALLSLGITAILLRTLTRRGLDPRWAALWAWCPLVATEAITNSHVDTFGAMLLLAATVLVSSGRRWLGGLALGVSIATKLIPVIGAPALLARQPWKIVLASVGVFLLLYVPYLISDGPKVLGYLPGYLSEEGYDDGSRFALITLVAPGTAALVVAAILLLALAVLVWRKTDPASPWLGQLAMIGITLLIVSPRYPWYALLLVPMIAMTGRWEWMLVPLALSARLLVPTLTTIRVAELVAILVIAGVSAWRAGPGWTSRVGLELRHPFREPARQAMQPR